MRASRVQAPAPRRGGTALTCLNLGALVVGGVVVYRLWKNTNALIEMSVPSDSRPTVTRDRYGRLRIVKGGGAHEESPRPAKRAKSAGDTKTRHGLHLVPDEDQAPGHSPRQRDDLKSSALQQSPLDTPIVIDLSEFEKDDNVTVRHMDPPQPYYGTDSGHHHH